jgi:hypothetical protein
MIQFARPLEGSMAINIAKWKLWLVWAAETIAPGDF